MIRVLRGPAGCGDEVERRARGNDLLGWITGATLGLPPTTKIYADRLDIQTSLAYLPTLLI
jgi:hypothetical protein